MLIWIPAFAGMTVLNLTCYSGFTKFPQKAAVQDAILAQAGIQPIEPVSPFAKEFLG